MARPRTPALDRIEQRSEWDENNHHLLWTGPLHRGKPFLRPEGSPVRTLLQIEDPRVYVRRTCSHDLCINPIHHRVQITQDHKYGDLPPPNLPRWLVEVEECLDLIKSGEATLDEIEQDYPELVVAKLKERLC